MYVFLTEDWINWWGWRWGRRRWGICGFRLRANAEPAGIQGEDTGCDGCDQVSFILVSLYCLEYLELWFNFLFQHEEVQFLENELENQKQKYLELVSFTKSLLSAVRNNDQERQQVHSVMFEQEIEVRRAPYKFLTCCVSLGTHGQPTSAFRPELGDDCG